MFPADCAARFRPERQLGSGGYGAVWRAHDLKLDRPAAVKLLHAEATSEAEQVARFEQEARITASLAHPNIVAVLDAGAADGIPWIAYELLEGKTLGDAAGRLPVHAALQAIQQVALALEAAHAAGVLHRDVKPANVLSAGDGHWKVADFGIARCSTDSRVKTATGVLMGTPAYMAPEQVNGAGSAVSSDLYALGISLYEVLTGEPPFLADAPLKVLRMHLEDAPPRPSAKRPDVSPELDRLVLRTLEKDPRARFATAAELAAALGAAIDGASTAPGAAPRRVRTSQATQVPGTARRSRPVQATVPSVVAGPAASPRTRVAGALALFATLAFGVYAFRASPPPVLPVVPVVPPVSATPAPSVAAPVSKDAEVIAYLEKLQPLGAIGIREYQRPGASLQLPNLRPAYEALYRRGEVLAPAVYARAEDDPVKVAFAGAIAELMALGRAVGGKQEADVMRERLRNWSQTAPNSMVARLPLTFMPRRGDKVGKGEFVKATAVPAPAGPIALVRGWMQFRYRAAKACEASGDDPLGSIRREAVREAIKVCAAADCMDAFLDVDPKSTFAMDDDDLIRSERLHKLLMQDRKLADDEGFQKAARGLWHDLMRRARLHLDAYDALHVALLFGRVFAVSKDPRSEAKTRQDLQATFTQRPAAHALFQALESIELKLGAVTTERLKQAIPLLLAARPEPVPKTLRDAYTIRRWCNGLIDIARELAHRDELAAALRCRDAVHAILEVNMEISDLDAEQRALAELNLKNPEAPAATNPK